ncbi:MAG TPA: cytochrome D1 domain-containing protein [Anaerolineales bacterium]|nr:cytochrome D1 domain-containing protein [Anaerolineales bacterium]
MSNSPTSPDSFQTFGDLLKYLRRRERLTQLELSIAVGYSEAQIGRLEKNQRRPDLTALKALFIPALHLESEPEFIARFMELAQSARQEDAPAPGIPPYKGLLFFDESDADLFFGRETLTTYLADRVTDLGMDSSSRFLAVVGASGSGKSSLVRAGLAVALRHAGWDVRIFTPGANPSKALEMQIVEMNQDEAGSDRILILVDQFEETFTLCRDESERVSFIEELLSLAQELSRRVTIAIALRADFYSHCAQYPILRQAVAAEQEYIGQMTVEELRRAIDEPAKRGGWEFEPGLVDVLLHDIGAQGTSEPEPGALPLLSHALLATWERRRGRTFTLDGYHASGGVRGAIAETAESVFTDQLNQTQQELARDIFLRLTELGEGTEDTRRRAALNELVRQSAEAMQLRIVLNTLAEARLITLNEDSAEVAHEALIREWQRLHEWLTHDREGLLLHRHLTESAYEWEARGHDPAELYRGARLAQTREWASANEEKLNASERAFLAASVEQEQHDALERESQRQRELEAAQKLADTQSRSAAQLRRRAMYLVGVLTLAIVAALAAGVFANRNATLAEQNASIAQTAQAASTQAIADFTRSEAQRLAAEANSLMLNNGDTNLIALLAIRSLNMQYTPAGDAILASLTTLESPPRLFTGHTSDVWGADISPDGKYLATGSADRTARLWDLSTGETIRIFSGHTADVGRVVFSPDGKFLLTGSPDGTARLWDVTSAETVQVFSGHADIVDVGGFSSDGKYIVTAGFAEKAARLWEVATGETVQIFMGHSDDVSTAAISPDGKYVFTGSMDRTARLWDTATGSEMRVFPGHKEGIFALAFSPDGKYIATGSDDYTARVWDAASGEMVREFSGHQGFVQGIDLSPHGRFLLTGSADQTARLWDVATGETLRIFSGHSGAVQTVIFSADGSLIATASNDGIARVWNLQISPTGIQFIGHSEEVWQASFSPDGKLVVTASNDDTARIWDSVRGQTINTLLGHTDDVRSAMFSADGKLVLTASADNTARLWDATSSKELQRFEGHTDLVNRAIFSPNGKYVVTTSYDGTARVWDAQTGETIVNYINQGSDNLNRIAFSPDGKMVATSGDDDTARIWDPLTGKDRIVIQQTDNVTGLAFSPDGNYLVTCSFDGSVRLWDVTSGTEVRRFAGHTVAAFGAAFSSDGKYILTSGRDGTARLWNVETGEEVRRFTGHTSEARDVAFSPDGNYILTASFDGTARLWFTEIKDTVDTVCALLTRDLTDEERVQFGIPDQDPTCPPQ